LTARTRRRLIFSLVLFALTVPVESVLLQAVSTTDAKTAAIDWAASLSQDSLSAAADNIEQYPFVYRLGIMKALSPLGRAFVWRVRITRYILGHSDLTDDTVSLLRQARALATPDNLSNPSADARAQMKSIGDQLVTAIGKDDADQLLYRLGPRDGTFQSLEPTRLKVANWVRDKFVALAADILGDCDCNQDFGGCLGDQTSCRTNTGCAVDDTWPACGWFWTQNCDGKCTTIIMSAPALGSR
jgi:hypothetical protein